MEVRRGLAAFVVASFLSASGFPAEAHADEPHGRTSSLSWVRMPGADACVATQDLAKRVEARLGRAVFVSASVADVSVEGRVEPLPGHPPHSGFRAVLTLRDAHGALLGTRELSRPEATCDAMTDPLILVIAVMIDPDAALAPAPKPPPTIAPPPQHAPPPAPVIIEKEVLVAAPVHPPKPEWRIDVGAAAITSLGLVPAPNIGIAASGSLEPPVLFPLEGFGALWFDDSTSNHGSQASFLLAYVGGGLCPLHYTGEPVHLYGCAIGELGAFSRAITGGTTSTDLYLAGGVEARMSVRIAGPFALRAGANAVVPLFRPDTHEGNTELFRPSFIGGAADVGVGVLLP